MTISAKRYWDRRYAVGQTSGPGSQGEPVENKVRWLSGLPDVSSIVEVGCGDFVFGSRLLQNYPEADYLGFDISDLIVRRNNLLNGCENVRFQVPLSHESFPCADLLLCIDVLFHILDDQEYATMLQKLKLAWTKYLAVSAYEYDNDRTSSHVRIRKFDPKFFGVPIRRYLLEQDGSLYLYLFRKTDD
jgi:trans-aconitate methyltransferase